MNIPIEIMSPFAQIAEIYCPNVYKQLLDQNLSNYSSKYFFKNIDIFLICLFLTFLCIFIFILIAHFLSYIRIFTMIMSAIRRKFHISSS
jgi:hypothetical protein